MPNAEVIGKAIFDFVDEKTKQPVQRVSLHLVYEEKSYEGKIAHKVSVEKSEVPQGGYSVGDIVHFEFNSKGRVPNAPTVVSRNEASGSKLKLNNTRPQETEQ